MTARQEGHSAAKIHSKATFNTPKDRAIHAHFVSIGFFETIPGLFSAGHFTADDSLALGVFCGTQENFDRIPYGDDGSFAGICKFFDIYAAFHFVADVDDGLSRFDCDDFAFDHCTLFGRVNLEAFLQKGFEFFHCYACHVASIPYVYVSGRAVVSAGLESHWSNKATPIANTKKGR